MTNQTSSTVYRYNSSSGKLENIPCF